MIRFTKSRDREPSHEPARYVSLGRGDRTVVLLHGLFGTPEHWRHIMDELAGDYRVIAPQLPVDHQPTRRGNGIRTIDDLTDHIADLILELDLPPFVICGNSLGGLVSIEICLRYPERVAGLVLAGSAGLYERSLSQGVKPQATREFVRSLMSDIFHDPCMVTDELISEWSRALCDRDFVRFILRVSRATRDRTLNDELQRLKLPTLIVWGRDDKVTPPEVAEAFKSKIEHAQLRFIENCGHAPNVEQPALFTEMLREFLPTCFPVDSKHASDPSSVAKSESVAPSSLWCDQATCF